MDWNLKHPKINNEFIFRTNSGVELWLKREDLIHPTVSGNKFRKLKYNLIHAKAHKLDTLVTFGGAFSNHIAAVAAAGEIYNFKTVGIIRGEELETKIADNPTLHFAKNAGMLLKFVSRATYREKTAANYLDNLKEVFPSACIIPEGGTNTLAVNGCEEILSEYDKKFDVICCSVGTGGTISGLINSASSHQKIIGFSALKGDFLSSEISKFATRNNWELNSNYHFGGYAKINEELIAFLNNFYLDFGIKFDPIYTGKMIFGIMDLIKSNYFNPNTKILAIHTGGLQGVTGMNLKLKSAKLPLINFE
ncbi:1-aminocyclopropane-1-carboxylate deaminase/D-cysteine desulfhydrase [Paucihalobacter ruber]|uniref:1-aminocyclopropane-1-carboxylate deaminase/D-cysteine desulfhydrase n=1 Tax=Paucihalobacter ruber TaxID=2567861 RepID=A0A506PI12_9FLAO|nr:pyridoxal-phosphate dependent enzyme [Paucihalobacter ruber]TPV32010.1 1-aminocyclopropane-1-carboxylate deaminase/D-cysteine desulfhydrase [Paucihalobacter ruber]